MIYPRTIHGYWKLKQNTMKTKEEILQAAYENKYASPKYSESVNRVTNFQYISPAMDEYAKEVAIAFAAWIGANFYYEHLLETWIKIDDNGCQPKTYADLFEKFIQSIKP